jgi:hypothetical protein
MRERAGVLTPKQHAEVDQLVSRRRSPGHQR